MATPEELRARAFSDLNTATRPTSIGPLTPMPQASVGVGGAASGGTRATTGSTQSRTGTAPRRTLTPTATNTGTSAADRVNRALAIRRSMGGVQGGRADAEAAVNPQIAESLRLALIEQERANAPTYGSQSIGDRRAQAREIQNAGARVETLTSAVGDIRAGQVTRAGQLTGAETTLQDRTQQEAGAFDRASINLDVAETQGEFGLRTQGARNSGALAVKQALDPREQFGLNLLSDAVTQVRESGDREAMLRVGTRAIDTTLGNGTMSGFGEDTAPVEIEAVDPASGQLVKQFVSPDVALRVGNYNQIMGNPTAFGLTEALTQQEADAYLSGTATIPDIQAGRAAQAEAEAAQRTEQDQAQYEAVQARREELRTLAEERRKRIMENGGLSNLLTGGLG